MNSFVHHHQGSIRFGYSCFDRIICNGFLPQFQHDARGGTIRWYLCSQRQTGPVTRSVLAKISRDYHEWLEDYARQTGVEIVAPPADVRREEWVEPYYQQLAGQHGMAVILKCREPERRAVHFAKSNQVGVERRWVNLYYCYLHDPQVGRMFLRICPYFPFNIRVWMNGHNWLACKLQQEEIAFAKQDNLFVECADPQRLQALSDAFGPEDIRVPVETWLARLLPFFSAADREQGYRHQLYMSQMEYCHNLIFHRPAVAQSLLDRLMDANRALGHPDKMAIVFGRPRARANVRTGETLIKMTRLRTPVISSHYRSASLKQYVSHRVGLRTEAATYQLKDLGVKKNIQHLPRLRKVLAAANDRYLRAQQDVLASYVDRGQLQELRRPTVSVSGRRVPGLHIDDPRLMAVLQALTCFAYLAGKGCFRTKDLLADVQKALDNPDYRLSQLRYDLSKLRGKGLVQRVEGTQNYQLTPEGYRLAILYLKLYHRLYAPLTAAIRDPVPGDNYLPFYRQHKLDRLYAAVDHTLQRLTKYLAIAA